MRKEWTWIVQDKGNKRCSVVPALKNHICGAKPHYYRKYLLTFRSVAHATSTTVVYIHTTELLIASRLAYVLIGGVGSKFNQAPLCWILMRTLSVDVWYRLKPLKHKTLSHQGSVMTGPQSGKAKTFKWPSKRLEGLRPPPKGQYHS